MKFDRLRMPRSKQVVITPLGRCVEIEHWLGGTHWDWPAPNNRRIFNGRFARIERR